MSIQVFRIIRAPEEPPLTSTELRKLISTVRKSSDWEVQEMVELGKVTNAKAQEKKT
jgi:hypothetical protein